MKSTTTLDSLDQLELGYLLHNLVSELRWFEIQTDPSSHYTRLAGTAYGNRIQNIRNLRKGDIVLLKRQPQNQHDSNAVQVLTLDCLDLGYLPREIAGSIYITLDALGGEYKATVAAIEGMDYRKSKPSVTISFTLPVVACTLHDRNSLKVQTPVLRSFHEVLSGHLCADELGRFFVMEITPEHALVSYESEEKQKSYRLVHLGKLLALWPFAERNTVQSIKDDLRKFGLSASGDIFVDYERLAAVERKCGNSPQLTCIRRSAPYRSKILAMRQMIPDDLSTDSFCFGSPPSLVRHSDDQIRHAASRLRTVKKVCLAVTIVIISVLLLFILNHISGGGLYSKFPERPLRLIIFTPILIVLMFILTLFVWFISLPIYFGIHALIVTIMKKALLQDDIKIRDNCLESINHWQDFLKNESARYHEWEEGYTQPCLLYRQAFLAYACMRINSPWSICLPEIWLSLAEKYPSKISLGRKPLEPWQKLIWESHNRVDGSKPLDWSSILSFRDTGIQECSDF